jgi:hypothetical protein
MKFFKSAAFPMKAFTRLNSRGRAVKVVKKQTLVDKMRKQMRRGIEVQSVSGGRKIGGGQASSSKITKHTQSKSNDGNFNKLKHIGLIGGKPIPMSAVQRSEARRRIVEERNKLKKNPYAIQRAEEIRQLALRHAKKN